MALSLHFQKANKSSKEWDQIKKCKINEYNQNINLDKYKTDRVIDTSLAKERKITKIREDRSRFYDVKLQPTSPSYSFKKLNVIKELEQK